MNILNLDKFKEKVNQENLKAHYFDRYSKNIDGSKLLSSVGDQSRPIQGGRCYNFDGIDDYIDISSIIPVLNNTGENTFEFWIKPKTDHKITSNGIGSMLISIGNIDEEFTIAYGSFVGNSDNELFTICTKINGNFKTDHIVDTGDYTNVWIHFALVTTATTRIIYVNGVPNILEHSETYNNLLNPITTALIGKRVIGNQFANVSLFNVKIWNEARTQQQIMDSINFKNINDGLLFWYKMDESVGTKSFDSSGNNLHGTIINATLSTFHSTQNNYSFQNEIGYSIDNVNYPNILIPAKNNTHDIFDNPLTYKNQVAYNAKLKQSNCITLDGVDDYIETNTRFDFIHETGEFELELYANFERVNEINNVDTLLKTVWAITNDAIGFRFGYVNKYNGSTSSPLNTLYFILNDTKYTVHSDAFENSEIQHIRVVGDGSKIKIFRNGNDVTVENINNAVNSSVKKVGSSTSTLTIGSGTASSHNHMGKIFGLKIKDNNGNLVAYYPMAEGAGTTVYDVVGNNNGTILNTSQTTVWGNQDVYHYNIQHQFSEIDGVKIPSNIKSGRFHNNAETQIDFTGGVASPFAVEKVLPTAYKFGDPFEHKNTKKVNRERNFLIYKP